MFFLRNLWSDLCFRRLPLGSLLILCQKVITSEINVVLTLTKETSKSKCRATIHPDHRSLFVNRLGVTNLSYEVGVKAYNYHPMLP